MLVKGSVGIKENPGIYADSRMRINSEGGGNKMLEKLHIYIFYVIKHVLYNHLNNNKHFC